MKRFLMFFIICLSAFFCITAVVYANDDCNHDWSDWTNTGTVNCIAHMQRECTICGDVEEKTVPDHAWSDWQAENEPSCAYEGSETRFCAVCHTVETQSIPATGNHQWSSWYTVAGATIYNAGAQWHYCMECGLEQTGSIARLSPFASFTQSKYTVYKGSSMQMGSVLGMANGDSVKSWKTSKKKVVSITKGGKIKAKKKGTAKITVTLSSGKKATCTIKVVKKPKASKKKSGGSVYITRTGIRYHCDPNCWGLRNANAIYKVSLSEAKSKGLTKCQVCY